MSAEARIRRYVETFNRHDAAGCSGHFATDAVVYCPFFHEPVKGGVALEALHASIWRAFPDIRWRLRSVIDGGACAAFDLSVSGVNDGPLEVTDGELPATGRAVSFETGVFWTVGPDGLITEERSYFDATGVAAQLGITF